MRKIPTSGRDEFVRVKTDPVSAGLEVTHSN